jgi:hypothetical protein
VVHIHLCCSTINKNCVLLLLACAVITLQNISFCLTIRGASGFELGIIGSSVNSVQVAVQFLFWFQNFQSPLLMQPQTTIPPCMVAMGDQV